MAWPRSWVSAVGTGQATEAGWLHRYYRRLAGGRSQAAAHGEAGVRAVPRRAWVHRRPYDREGIHAATRTARPPGHAQADFGEAVVVIDGIEQKAHVFVMDLPHSDACYVRAYPAATAEAWADGHVHAFVFSSARCLCRCSMTTTAAPLSGMQACPAGQRMATILPDGTRQRAALFSGFLSHYLFRDRDGRPGKGNDKGNAEGLVGYSRRNFMVPIPRFATWGAFNDYLETQCLKRQADVLRGQSETIGQRLERDLAAMPDLPAAPFDACDQATGRVSSQALLRYKTNGDSVPVAYGHRDVWIRGYVDMVVIGCGSEVIARHLRCYNREDMAFDAVHSLQDAASIFRFCACLRPSTSTISTLQ